MSNLDLNGFKKRKRGDRVFKFKNFGDNGYPVEFNGLFHQNVVALLEFGQSETGLLGGKSCWSFQLEVYRHPPVYLSLFVVEELVETSVDRHCRNCKYIGWGDHMICNKKYHFLVPSKDAVSACNNMSSRKFNLVELEGHLLHGVFHSNGFGHLLCINGLETGSALAGYKIMELWDRLCTGLGAREVSLCDYSQKANMDLRLLNGVAHGEPWFGKWGYKFGHGSFGVTQEMYHKAIKAIQNIPLTLIANHFNNFNNEISTIFSRYQMPSGHSLATLSDLFRFIQELKHRLPKETGIDSCNPGILVDSACRWSPKRVEMATRVVVESLKRAEFRWVSRQEVRDAARAYIGDTGLLDFVLKSLGNHIVGNYLVRRCLNPVTKVLEYCLEEISNSTSNQEHLVISNDHSKIKARYKITRAQLMKDMFYLYKTLLNDQKPTSNNGVISTIQLASRIILDTKYLVKQYCWEPALDIDLGEFLRLQCSIKLTNYIDKVGDGLEREMSPPECVILKNNATFDELIVEIENTFKKTYFGLRNFVVESIPNMDMNGSDLVSRVLKNGSKLVFKGRIIGGKGTLDETSTRCEGVERNCVMDCPCGGKEDDGERMVSCDICEVWQHTRCLGIQDTEEIPNIFLCNCCEQDIMLLPSLP